MFKKIPIFFSILAILFIVLIFNQDSLILANTGQLRLYHLVIFLVVTLIGGIVFVFVFDKILSSDKKSKKKKKNINKKVKIENDLKGTKNPNKTSKDNDKKKSNETSKDNDKKKSKGSKK